LVRDAGLRCEKAMNREGHEGIQRTGRDIMLIFYSSLSSYRRGFKSFIFGSKPDLDGAISNTYCLLEQKRIK
jgi:hypothetical protein